MISFKLFLLGLFSVMLFGMGPVIAAENAVFIYDDHGNRDPFWPLVTPGGAIVNYDNSFSVSEMTLEGVVLDDNGGVAIINGNVYELGQRVGIYILEKIEANKVILAGSDKSSVLYLKKED